MYLAALAAGVVWLAAIRGDEVAELLEHARLPLITGALAATFGLIFLTGRFWVLSLRMLGHRTTLSEVALATARTLPARYVPVGVASPQRESPCTTGGRTTRQRRCQRVVRRGAAAVLAVLEGCRTATAETR